jgi:hypothetical protein
VADPADRQRLAVESPDRLAVAGVLWEQHLHRNALADEGMLGLVDCPHATLADLAQDAVLVLEDRPDDLHGGESSTARRAGSLHR